MGLRRLRLKSDLKAVMQGTFTWMPWPAGTHARTGRHAMGVFGPEATGEGPASPPERLTEGRMGDIVNLRRARKQAERQLAERTASANRLRHGRSQAERELQTKRDAKARPDPDRHPTQTEDERRNLRPSNAP